MLDIAGQVGDRKIEDEIINNNQGQNNARKTEAEGIRRIEDQ